MANKKGGKRNQSGNIEEKTLELVRPIIENAGFTLWDVVFEKEGAMWYLRVLFDKEGGISSTECAEITEPINAVIDAESFISEIDILEIGSPGLTCRLRKPEHFEKMNGQPVRVSMKDKNNKTIYKTGILEGFDIDNNIITISGEEVELRKNTKINLDL